MLGKSENLRELTEDAVLSRGLGRSYGDSSLPPPSVREVRGLIPASERSSSQKRERPSARSRTNSSVHFPQTISAVRQTGQSGSMAQHFTR